MNVNLKQIFAANSETNYIAVHAQTQFDTRDFDRVTKAVVKDMGLLTENETIFGLSERKWDEFQKNIRAGKFSGTQLHSAFHELWSKGILLDNRDLWKQLVR